ncbi:hypothetical protein [Aestuariivirga litoralis]|uniref:hypothetical protein n=1 Tax=Aestuariivirga litoralis TaxID=2650924 RepID=UPI0018C5DA11|nr:hypothetical protein [Aestuariivirga litoralis]MBG1232129.1 hypothetical protein [Aestuariivirga litoralis]
MFRTFATAALLTSSLFIMGGNAFADSSALTGDDYQALQFAAKHGSCSMHYGTKVCTNFNSGGSMK